MVLGHFGHGHFGLGCFGPDISATDVLATENGKGGGGGGIAVRFYPVLPGYSVVF